MEITNTLGGVKGITLETKKKSSKVKTKRKPPLNQKPVKIFSISGSTGLKEEKPLTKRGFQQWRLKNLKMMYVDLEK